MSINDLVKNIDEKYKLRLLFEPTKVDVGSVEDRFAFFYGSVVRNSPPGFYEHVNTIIRELATNAPPTAGARAAMTSMIGSKGMVIVYADRDSHHSVAKSRAREYGDTMRVLYHLSGVEKLRTVADEVIVDFKSHSIACVKYAQLEVASASDTRYAVKNS